MSAETIGVPAITKLMDVKAPDAPKGPGVSIFGHQEISHTGQIGERIGTVDQEVSRTKALIMAYPPALGVANGRKN